MTKVTVSPTSLAMAEYMMCRVAITGGTVFTKLGIMLVVILVML